MLDSLPGPAFIFHSVDTSDTNEDDPEIVYLLSIYKVRDWWLIIPPPCLVLKVGCPIMLLWNLYPFEGLCNGTHMIVTRLCIEVQILGGTLHGQHKLIPCIS